MLDAVVARLLALEEKEPFCRSFLVSTWHLPRCNQRGMRESYTTAPISSEYTTLAQHTSISFFGLRWPRHRFGFLGSEIQRGGNGSGSIVGSQS